MRFLPCFLLLTAAMPVFAGGFGDPFDTEGMTPLRPSPRLAARVGEAPCSRELPSAPLTALDVIDLALCNHPQTREVWAAARVQAALVGVARAGWLPSLTGSAGVTRFDANTTDYTRKTAGVTLSWLVYDFGLRSANIENAGQLLEAAAATQDATVQSLFLSALQSYYAAQATRAAVVSATEAERAAGEAFAAADARYGVGVATPADRLQAQTALSQARLNRIRAEGDARNALGALAYALGFAAGQPLALAELPPAPATTSFRKDLDALLADAQRRRPDLKAAEAQLRAAEAGIDVARAQGRPTLAVSSAPSWQDQSGGLSGTGTTRGNTLGVTLSVPLFNGFDTTYRVRSAAAQAEVRAAQRDRLKNQVALDVWKAYQSLGTATQSLATAADLVASAEQSERVARGRYQAGVGTVLDLLTAQSALASARLQRIQAELDWNVYRATLAQAVGTLDYTLLQETAAEEKP